MGKNRIKANFVCRCGKTSEVTIFIRKFPLKIRCPSCHTVIIVHSYMKIDDSKGTRYELVTEYEIKSGTITLEIRSDTLPDRVSFTNRL